MWLSIPSTKSSWFLRVIAGSVMLGSAVLRAQTKPLQLNVVYDCSPGSQRMKILSCAGDGDDAMCEVQSYTRAELGPRRKATRKELTSNLKYCHVQTPAEAKADAAAPGSRPARAAGQSRLLPQKAAAEGPYKAGEHIQVLFEGSWVDCKIEVTRGSDYMVSLAGDRTAWTTAAYMRHVAADPASAPKPGQPYKPGFASCAGKIEGRYSSTGGSLLGIVSIEFRSGKAIIRDDSIPYWECWIDGTKIILHVPNDLTNGAQDQKFDINDNGTLDTPLGELKKKGN
jgi:hypothetical protein